MAQGTKRKRVTVTISEASDRPSKRRSNHGPVEYVTAFMLLVLFCLGILLLIFILLRAIQKDEQMQKQYYAPRFGNR